MSAKTVHRDDDMLDDDDDDDDNSNDGIITFLIALCQSHSNICIEAENGLSAPKKKSEKAKWIPSEVSLSSHVYVSELLSNSVLKFRTIYYELQ
jgi:hypothetical protein